MNMRIDITRKSAWIACFLIVWCAESLFAATPLDFRVTPDYLHVRESFQGASVNVSAEIPKGASAVIEVKGRTHDVHLLRKGRRGGLWMNVGDVHVRKAPSLYLMMSTDAGIPGRSDVDAPWGYSALRKTVQFEGSVPKGGPAVLFEQLVRLKESQGLYGVFPGALKLTQTGDHATVQGTIRLPSNIAPGNYQILVSVLNSGKLLAQKSVDFPVEMKGLPALFDTLAHQHALLYGLLAVSIAILTGFVMGFVFKGKAAH